MKLIMTVLLSLPAAAFAADRPGQHFLLKPSDLPKPYATPAVANNNQVIPRPAGIKPQAPKGFTVSIFADHLDNARGLLAAPNGDVFVSERIAGKITLLRDTKGANRRSAFHLCQRPEQAARHGAERRLFLLQRLDGGMACAV